MRKSDKKHCSWSVVALAWIGAVTPLAMAADDDSSTVSQSEDQVLEGERDEPERSNDGDRRGPNRGSERRERSGHDHSGRGHGERSEDRDRERDSGHDRNREEDSRGDRGGERENHSGRR